MVMATDTYILVAGGMDMKICWLNDYKLSEFVGGAQITNSIMIKKGKELGHTIEEFTPKDFKSNLDTPILEDYDLCILNNISAFKPEVIEWIIANKPYVVYSHDYSFCAYRNAMCKGCDQNPCSPAPIFIKLYRDSKLNIFLSPLHLNIHKKFFKETMRDAIYIPSPMIEGQFTPNKDIQQDAYLYAGSIMDHKGVSQILDFADSTKGKIFHFAGRAVHKKLMDRINEKYLHIGEMSFEEMPKLYQKYKHFIVNPIWPEPFGRSIIESMMAGCTLTRFAKTEQTGVESYNISPKEMIDRCIKAPIKFWNEVKNATK